MGIKSKYKIEKEALAEHSKVMLRGAPKMKRACLRCSREFETPNKYIRMCMTCKRTQDWHEGTD